jgi:hypothetical protein
MCPKDSFHPVWPFAPSLTKIEAFVLTIFENQNNKRDVEKETTGWYFRSLNSGPHR